MKKYIRCCVDRLAELGLQVAWMGYNLDGFGQSEWFGENFDLLVFLCVKGQWSFVANFTESTDCVPGIFKLHSVENFHTLDSNFEETKYLKRIYCDLFCQNTGEDALARVLELFKETSVKNLIEKKFGHILSFAEDLKTFLAGASADGGDIDAKNVTIVAKKIKVYPFEYLGESCGGAH